MDLCDCKYSSHRIKGISQVFHKSTTPTSNSNKMFQHHYSTFQPSNSCYSKVEEVVDSNMALSEKLQNIMDKCNEAEKCSNTEPNQHFVKELAVLE